MSTQKKASLTKSLFEDEELLLSKVKYKKGVALNKKKLSRAELDALFLEDEEEEEYE